MKKPFRIAPWVVPEDLQSIYDYHKQLSPDKAERIVAEYDRIIALLEVNPLLFHERKTGGACILSIQARTSSTTKSWRRSGWSRESFMRDGTLTGYKNSCAKVCSGVLPNKSLQPWLSIKR